MAATMAARLSAAASAVIATSRGSGVRRRVSVADRPGELGGLVDRQLARRAGHEVQADRIGAGADVAATALPPSLTPQIFTNGGADVGRIGRQPPGGHERAAAAAGSADRISASPTSAASNPCARQRAIVAGVADARTRR